MSETAPAAPSASAHPRLIQGGMGVGVSGWRLARAVSRTGQMGVVSGTALDVVHARRLADGDVGGHLRSAYEQFPVPGVAERVLDRYFCPSGRRPGAPYPVVPTYRLESDDALVELTVLANFAEVVLARGPEEGRGAAGPIGINYLEKVQLPLLYGLYGAVLAEVDYVLMGAGIPSQVPGVLRRLARGEPTQYRLSAEVADTDAARAVDTAVSFDPSRLFGTRPERPVPRLLAIISSHTLGRFLVKDPETAPYGFVVEAPIAGGHNAPPRGRLQLTDDGQPVYGPRDVPDLEDLAALGRPFWLAGGYGDHEGLVRARSQGAVGVQVGTAFALCEESDMDPSLKAKMLDQAARGELEVRTDPRASPSGYPFKVVGLEGTVADLDLRQDRTRVCDLGYLRTVVVDAEGEVAYRCPAEPVSAYVRKGGAVEDTEGRACLCNGLTATIGLGQERAYGTELPIVTAGDDLARIAARFGPSAYSAADVVAAVVDGAVPDPPAPFSG